MKHVIIITSIMMALAVLAMITKERNAYYEKVWADHKKYMEQKEKK